MRLRDLDNTQIFERMSEGVLILTHNTHQNQNRNLKQFHRIKFVNKVARRIVCGALGGVVKLSDIDIELVRFVQITLSDS